LISTTGLTKGAIYGNFKDKDEVALAAFRHNYKIVSEGILAEISLETKYASKLKAITRYYRENMPFLANLGGCPLLNTALDSAYLQPELEKESTKAFRSYHDVIRRTIEKGKEAQEFYNYIDAKVYASIILSLIERGIAIAKSMKDQSFLMDALKKVDEIIESEFKV